MEARISREQALMQTALIWSQRSTCYRRAVGAVIAVDNRVVSVGYNGAPAGEPHCTGVTCVPAGQSGCVRAVHAETNAINYLPGGLEDTFKTMYTTESPCLNCAALIRQSGFLALYYLNEYRIDTGIRYLIREGVPVYRMTLGGYIARKHLIDGLLLEGTTL